VSLASQYVILGIQAIRITLIPILLFLSLLIYNRNLNIKKIFLVFHLTGLLVIIIGYYFYLFQPIFYGELLINYRAYDTTAEIAATYSRMVSVILSPNIYGTYTGLLFISSIQFIFVSKKRFTRLIMLIMSALYLGALTLTLSRGAWLFGLTSMLIMSLFYLFGASKSIRKLPMILISIMTASTSLVSNKLINLAGPVSAQIFTLSMDLREIIVFWGMITLAQTFTLRTDSRFLLLHGPSHPRLIIR
jgi:hypothetical protein